MEKEINRIFNRQFERCKSDLLEVNCPQVFIDCVSKYFNFARMDINEITQRNMENDEINGNRIQ